MKHYYAISDTFTGNDPKEFTSGFANTTCAIAFKSYTARKKWLEETKLLKARAITRKEAIKLTRWQRGEYVSLNRCERAKAVYTYEGNDIVVLQESKY